MQKFNDIGSTRKHLAWSQIGCTENKLQHYEAYINSFSQQILYLDKLPTYLLTAN
jgi:hypothetical protein